MTVVRAAAILGAQRAVDLFGAKHASVLTSLLELIGTTGGASMARGAINSAAPNLMPKLEGLGAAMVPKFLRKAPGAIASAAPAAATAAARLPTSPAILR